ncbi:hypothetical protein GH714_012589 [Hevea brasiliensis]|uniref:DUF674 family protein n=1 Tax=Hevea brasiliensis TaxID=3981 RepID=A0A6A6L4H9_HEVBR|nr:hypothetical protein GH714_012589 [Hevea brasiliensis]
MNTPTLSLKLLVDKKASKVLFAEAGKDFVDFLFNLLSLPIDDLSVSIMSMITGVALLNKFNVKDFGVLEEKVVEFGIDQGVELLKASLQSKAALTSVFLVNKEVKDGAALN